MKTVAILALTMMLMAPDAFAAASPKSAEVKKGAKASETKSFAKVCTKTLESGTAVQKSKASSVCECIERGLKGKKISADEMNFLIALYEKSQEREKMIEAANDDQSILMDFEADLAGKCLENPKFELGK